MLLLNVARARHAKPLHFTTVSGIAATFEHRGEGSLAADFAGGDALSLLSPGLSFAVSESPTISIVPIQGEEFTKRLLTRCTSRRSSSSITKTVTPTCCYGCSLTR